MAMLMNQYCNSTISHCYGTVKIHTVTVDYPITWVGHTVTVGLFLAVYIQCDHESAGRLH